MKKLVLALSAIVLFSTVYPLLAKPPTEQTQPVDHTQWIASVLKEIGTVKVGMTRKELLTVFTTEGGIYTPMTRTYVHRGCPYIKIDVEFRPVDQTVRGRFQENAKDTITKISKPYLQWSIID